MSYKDFDAALKEMLGDRPSFTMGGQTFTCRQRLPWKKFSNMILSLSGEEAQAGGGLDKTEEFFRLVLIKGDRDRFIGLLNYDGEDEENGGDDELAAAPQQVGELLDWLLAYYTGKADTTDESSSDKPLPAGVELKSVSLSSAK